MRKIAEYNGWSNYQTWLVNQYYGEPDEDFIQEMYADNNYDMQQTIDGYAEYLKEIVESEKPSNLDGFFQEKIDNFLKEINYKEIAEHIIESCTLTNDESSEEE